MCLEDAKSVVIVGLSAVVERRGVGFANAQLVPVDLLLLAIFIFALQIRFYISKKPNYTIVEPRRGGRANGARDRGERKIEAHTVARPVGA